MKYEKLALEQYRELTKLHKAAYQAWDKTKAIYIKYVGTEATATATVADYDGMTIRYAGTGAGTVKVEENKVTISGNSVPTEFDLTHEDYDTMGELVYAIHNLADWTCEMGADIATLNASKHLKILGETDCKTGDVTCLMDRALYIELATTGSDINVGVGGKVFLRDTEKDTLAELVAFLNGLDDYECSLGDQFDGDETSVTLSTVVAISIKTGAWLARDTNFQIKITVPAVTTDKQVIFTDAIGKSTYGSGTSAFQVYDGSTLVWQEDAGATTVEKTCSLPKLTITAGNQMVVKILNSAAMTAGLLVIGYEEKFAAPYTVY